MAELKTKKTRSSVTAFLNSIPETQKREDCWAIAKMMRAATKAAPKMWGASIVGFGHCCLVYPSGKEIDWMQVAFSPRKANITLYLNKEVLQTDLMAKLGKKECGKGCLYIKKLSDVDIPTLEKLIRETIRRKGAPSS
jgi:hypothetical protein